MKIKKLFDRIMLLANIAFAFLLLLIYLSSHINPSSFWPASILGLTYLYVLFFNIGFSLYWIYRKKKYVFISILILLLGWNFNKANIKFGTKHKDGAEGLKVISYNIKMLDITENPNSQQKKDIIDFLNRESPDIFCLQEYHCPVRVDYIYPNTLIEEYKEENSVIERRKKPWNYGLAIFSKLRMIDHGQIKFESTMNFILYADYIYQNDTIRVYNAHLQSVGFQREDYNLLDSLSLLKNNNRIKHASRISSKLKQAFEKRSEQVNTLVEHISQSPYKVIVCGDFNDTPVSYTYKHMSSILEDSFLEKGRGLGYTYARKTPFRIDYIMHSKELKTNQMERFKIKASDHYPVMARITFDNEK